jgi:hypothetical protein
MIPAARIMGATSCPAHVHRIGVRLSLSGCRVVRGGVEEEECANLAQGAPFPDLGCWASACASALSHFLAFLYLVLQPYLRQPVILRSGATKNLSYAKPFPGHHGDSSLLPVAQNDNCGCSTSIYPKTCWSRSADRSPTHADVCIGRRAHVQRPTGAFFGWIPNRDYGLL